MYLGLAIQLQSFEAYVSQNSFDTDTDLTAQFEQILDRYSEIADVTRRYAEKVRNEEDYMRSAESKQWVKEHREAACEAKEIHDEVRELLEKMESDIWDEELDIWDEGDLVKSIDYDAVAGKLGENVAVIVHRTWLLAFAEASIDGEDDSRDGVISKISSIFSQ